MLNRAVWRCGWCRHWVGRSIGSQPWAANDEVTQFSERDPVTRVDLEDTLENAVELISDGKNGLQKVPVTHVSPEGGILD